LEAIQRRALHIIYPPTIGMPYIFALTLPQLPPLHDRREKKEDNFQIYTLLLHFLLTSYPQKPWRYFQIASCICLSTPGYTHKTIHILHQLFFITLSVNVNDVIYDFGCFTTMLSFPCIAWVHFIIVLFFFYRNLAVFITCYWNNKLTYLLTYHLENSHLALYPYALWQVFVVKILNACVHYIFCEDSQKIKAPFRDFLWSYF